MATPTVNYVISAVDRTEAAFRSVDRNISGITKSFQTLAGFTGFAAITASITNLGRKAFELGSTLHDTSQQLGISVESLQVFTRYAEDAGGGLDDLKAGLGFLTRLTGAAAQGNREAAASFQRLGINAKTFAALDMEGRFKVLATQISSVKDPTTRLELAYLALGRGATSLAGALSEGPEALQRIRREMEQTHALLTQGEAEALDTAGKKWDKFWDGLERGGIRAAVSVAGSLSDIFTSLASKLPAGASFPGAVPVARPQPRTAASAGGRGLSADEAAAVLGIPGKKSAAAALKLFKDTSDELDALFAKDHKAVIEKQQAAIARIFEQTRTPFEAYQLALENVAKLQKSGLGADVAEREIERLGKVYADQARSVYEATDAGAAWTEEWKRGKEIAEGLITPFQAVNASLDETAKLYADGAIGIDAYYARLNQVGGEYHDATAKISEGNAKLADSTTRLLESIKVGVDGFANDLTDVFFNTTQGIGKMFEQLAVTIAKSLFTQNVSAPLLSAFSGALSGAFGGGVQPIPQSWIPAHRALGGPVTAGSPYLVGERGPELFVPRQNGTILPNASGGDTVNVNFTVNSLDPATAASVIAANKQMIVGIIRGATARTGRRASLA